MMRMACCFFALTLVGVPSAAWPQEDAKTKIAALEKKLAEKPDHFDWDVHNQLRHLYSTFDKKKAGYHVDVVLRHAIMDGYMLDVLGARGGDKKPGEAVRRLVASADEFPEYRFLSAAARLKAADLAIRHERRIELLKQVADMKGDDLERYRLMALAKLSAPDRPVSKGPWIIPVLVINYFPLTADKKSIDKSVTGNVGAPLEKLAERCRKQTEETVKALEQGSRFRLYRDSKAEPSLRYKVVDNITFYEAMPHHPKKKNYADYYKTMKRVNIHDWVDNKGIREVWIWGYHSKEIAPVESNMSSVHGNVSNSYRDPFDLPLAKHTYTVYHYNYGRGTDMAVHNHLHQIEAVMRTHGGTLWQTFEGKPGAWRAGNCHFPVNGERDYDYGNKKYVETDIEDWMPEGFGKKQKMNSERWGGNDLKWYVYWMQAIPGANNGLTYQGRPLTNWWELIGDYDQAVVRKSKLTN